VSSDLTLMAMCCDFGQLQVQQTTTKPADPRLRDTRVDLSAHGGEMASGVNSGMKVIAVRSSQDLISSASGVMADTIIPRVCEADEVALTGSNHRPCMPPWQKMFLTRDRSKM
jgi:hypothetical protein